MKVDAKFESHAGLGVGAAAAAFEAAGFDATDRLRVGTAVAVAFARSPMNLAYLANDLQQHSGGRFTLGLGSQVRPHIERRFSMPWSRPAARMREYVLLLRAIWRCWATGDRPAFRGDFYSCTLMTPFFSPGPNPAGPPPIHLAAVGETMTQVAGEVADGLLVHPFTTRRYLAERTLPGLERGAAATGRGRTDLEVSCPCLVATGATEEAMAAAVAKVREQVAFYGSTPAYRPVLDLHGWGELGAELTALSVSRRPDRWAAMTGLIDDAVLREFAVVAEPGGVADGIRRRLGGLADRISFYSPYEHGTGLWRAVLDDLRRETEESPR